MNKKCLLAYLLILLLLIEGFFFSYYVAKNQEHFCSDGHCPICLVLHEATTILNQLATGLATVITTILLVFVSVGLLEVVSRNKRQTTPVQWKVRMNN